MEDEIKKQAEIDNQAIEEVMREIEQEELSIVRSNNHITNEHNYSQVPSKIFERAIENVIFSMGDPHTMLCEIDTIEHLQTQQTNLNFTTKQKVTDIVFTLVINECLTITI